MVHQISHGGPPVYGQHLQKKHLLFHKVLTVLLVSKKSAKKRQ